MVLTEGKLVMKLWVLAPVGMAPVGLLADALNHPGVVIAPQARVALHWSPRSFRIAPQVSFGHESRECSPWYALWTVWRTLPRTGRTIGKPRYDGPVVTLLTSHRLVLDTNRQATTKKIVLDARKKGVITTWQNHPLSREAVAVRLPSLLGLVPRNEHTLTCADTNDSLDIATKNNPH
jgi:hypothetical protein